MTDYRRNRVPGGTYFFTVNLFDRRSELLVREIETLRDAVRVVRAKARFHVDAWVVLPEHIHCMWTLPAGDTNFAARWQGIKTQFCRRIAAGEPRSASRAGNGERGIWQRRCWEHTIGNDRDYAAHVDYIHFNPIRRGLVTYAADWQYSSFRRCVARALYPLTWNGGATEIAETGEPLFEPRDTRVMRRASLTHPTLATY